MTLINKTTEILKFQIANVMEVLFEVNNIVPNLFSSKKQPLPLNKIIEFCNEELLAQGLDPIDRSTVGAGLLAFCDELKAESDNGESYTLIYIEGHPYFILNDLNRAHVAIAVPMLQQQQLCSLDTKNLAH